MSEYHLRDGDWCGIGFYRVSDNYIARFSRFSTCDSWEGRYTLDFVVKIEEVSARSLFTSTRKAKSAAIFGLAYLLGIQLMPRIRNGTDLYLRR